jgi:hypothetical protein
LRGEHVLDAVEDASDTANEGADGSNAVSCAVEAVGLAGLVWVCWCSRALLLAEQTTAIDLGLLVIIIDIAR